MKRIESKGIIENVKKRNYVLIGSTYYPPNSPEALKFIAETSHTIGENKNVLKGLKTGFIDDTRNLKNKELHRDTFDMMVKAILNIEIWNEFYFSTERAYRIDKAIPVAPDGTIVKIGIEIQGGIWLRGKSGHSSGTGIKRDMEKNNLAASLGWTIIKVEPFQVEEPHWGQTIDLIKKAIELKNL